MNRPIRWLEIVVTNYRHKSFSGGLFPFSGAFRGVRVRLRLAKYNLTPVASILVNGEHFRRPILVILKIPKMEMVVCDEV